MKTFSVEFNLCDSEYMTALRLVAGAVASVANADVDTLEDFKVCVTESAIILKNCGFERVKGVFDADGVTVCMQGFGGSPVEGDCGLSLALIGAMVKNCDIEKKDGIICKVTLKI